MKNILYAIAIMLLVSIIECLIIALILTPTWNAVMPYLFNLPTITYWQGVCLMLVVDSITSPITNTIHQAQE